MLAPVPGPQQQMAKSRDELGCKGGSEGQRKDGKPHENHYGPISDAERKARCLELFGAYVPQTQSTHKLTPPGLVGSANGLSKILQTGCRPDGRWFCMLLQANPSASDNSSCPVWFAVKEPKKRCHSGYT